MNKKIVLAFLLMLQISWAQGQDLPEVKQDQTWKEKIYSLAPEKATFHFSEKKKILVFSLHTGYEHWVIPHTEQMIKIISEKSGAFEVTGSKDISMFEAKNLAKYDAIVLNNTCSKGDHRNLFWDKLRADSDADSAGLMNKALQLEKNLLKYVENGGGLLLVHGAVTTQNNSRAFSKLVGASFDYHPPQQAIQIRLADPKHLLVQAFPATGFNHVDEPYFYKNAYADLDFKPLLYFNNAEITDQKNPLTEGKTYVAWIRAQGKGKVMYCSPSHNAQSFENPDLLRFYLNGLQYVVGEVECDETPIGKGSL
ncbi:ThuA domain-containing protein [Aquiflexum gelatinilyticum]|uniref:ThuA domain-containing protein n=1 Tax=Aquiflexum gelatinilyticum TaxID=2961943 RepID=A0A9X2PB15_9BACT|nr:ThuA domain-containing protein [Aquiflexum gelatinilyticum]MCR9016752.1 ThuA domain-containing protein [Aquiflexum gelatinilyticum]